MFEPSNKFRIKRFNTLMLSAGQMRVENFFTS